MFLPSCYRALVKRCNLLRGASGRERHSNPPAFCSFDFYGLKLAMKPSKFHYKIFELHSLHNKTLFRKFWLYYTMLYPWNATVLRHKLFNRVHRAIYVRNQQIDGFCALRIYWRICVFAADAAPTGANHEPRRLASRRSAAGMSRRRFDLKVKLQVIRLPFNRPAPLTFVKRRRAIPTFGYWQAP